MKKNAPQLATLIEFIKTFFKKQIPASNENLECEKR